MYKWKVMPLCKEQLLDVDPKDVLYDGVFRKCNVYKSGGGYDRFPDICYSRLGKKLSQQFVIQLQGCHLSCPYCYVTPNGVWGDCLYYTSDELITLFLQSGCNVLHLMGGSPALYIEAWSEIIDRLPKEFVFHSDLLLTEKRYDTQVLQDISQENCLYAVNIKGVSPENYKQNTHTKMDGLLLHLNMCELVYNNVPFYVTFTNPDMNHYEEYCDWLRIRFGEGVLKDSFIIDLKEYDAVEAYKEKASGSM